MSRGSGIGNRESTSKISRSLFALLCLSIGRAAFGAETSSAATKEKDLPNGVRVIVEARPWTETVAVRLLLGGGHLEEPAGRAGVSDLHAAMLLRGTREKSGFAVARAAEELGGRLTAYSRAAAESIAIEVPSANLEPAIRLVAELLLAPRLDAADLAKEKTLLTGSLATAHDQPETLFDDEIYRTIFPAHPLSRLASLTPAEIAAVSIADVRALQRTRLNAARIALIVVGRCSAERVEALAGELLGSIQRESRSASDGGPFGPSVSPPPPLAADVARRVRKRSTQSMLAVALPTSGASDRELPALALLQHILSGFDERLYDEIREKRGYAYWVRSQGYEFPSAGAFVLSTGAEEKYFPEIDRIIRAELARIASEPVRPEELQRAVRYLRTEEGRRDETNGGRVGVLANELVEGAPLRSYDERVARLAAVTKEEIRDLAKRIFAGKHVAVITLY